MVAPLSDPHSGQRGAGAAVPVRSYPHSTQRTHCAGNGPRQTHPTPAITHNELVASGAKTNGTHIPAPVDDLLDKPSHSVMISPMIASASGTNTRRRESLLRTSVQITDTIASHSSGGVYSMRHVRRSPAYRGDPC